MARKIGKAFERERMTTMHDLRIESVKEALIYSFCFCVSFSAVALAKLPLWVLFSFRMLVVLSAINGYVDRFFRYLEIVVMNREKYIFFGKIESHIPTNTSSSTPNITLRERHHEKKN